jgi:hypothetical protein
MAEALSKDSDDPQTLVNLIVVAGHTNKPAEVQRRYLAQLRDVAPEHAYAKYYMAKEDMFRKYAEQFTAAA